MKKLTDKERSEIQEAEEARSVNIMYHHVHVLSVNEISLYYTHMNIIIKCSYMYMLPLIQYTIHITLVLYSLFIVG